MSMTENTRATPAQEVTLNWDGDMSMVETPETTAPAPPPMTALPKP